MGFNFDAMFSLFNNPVIIGAFIFIILLITGLLGYIIIRNMRGGFGKLSRPKDVFQRCFCITPSNNLVLYKMRSDDEHVIDDKNMISHYIYPDALIPEARTGQMWLPVDIQAACPLYPFNPELQKKRNKDVEANISFIAAKEDAEHKTMAQYDANRSQNIGMQQFALVSVIIIFLIIAMIFTISKLF